MAAPLANEPSTKVLVTVLGDFPAPVAGVITLEDDFNYQIAGTVDISPNRIVCGLRNGISGTNRRNDILVSDTTGALLTVNAKVALICDEVSFSCANGSVLDSTDTTTSFLNSALGPCASGGTVVSNTSSGFTMRTSGFTVSGTGITFSGTSTGNVRIFDNVVNSTAGTAFAFGTSVSNNINVSRNEASLGAGSSFVSGTTAGANVTTFGRLTLNQFSGAGTPVLTLTNSDAKWLWVTNAGVTNSTFAISDTSGLQAALDAKQATLVSATNIKTINGASVLGSGDLPVSAADPSYTPGSFTIVTGSGRMFIKRLQLTTTQRGTVSGTARLRMSN